MNEMKLNVALCMHRPSTIPANLRQGRSVIAQRAWRRRGGAGGMWAVLQHSRSLRQRTA
jgi:hypothetical protein